jgi:uncharacterized protein
MRIGILSDTHGRIAATAAALEVLRAASPQLYIHCGDVGGEAVFDLMAGLPLMFVWGNTDYDIPALRRYAENLGLDCRDQWGEAEADGKRLAFTHGDEPALMRRLIAEGGYQYLLYGHTHVAKDERINGVRVINPGALFRTSRPSVALLDTASDQLQFIAVKP